MQTVMVFAAILTALATGVIGWATFRYVTVTTKLWQATLDTAQRTQELVRQSQETLRLQLIGAFLQETGRSVVPEGLHPLFFTRCQARVKEVRLLLRESFPAEWAKIEQNVDRIERQMVEQWRPWQKEP